MNNTINYVYVAGPYTKGDVAINVRQSILAADALFENGFSPYVPHLTHFWHLVSPRPYGDWLRLDLQWLPFCNALLRLPGESSGADKEEEVAKGLGIPVFYNLEDLVNHFKCLSK